MQRQIGAMNGMQGNSPKSNGAARDLIKAGAVSLDGERFVDPFGKAPLDGLKGKTLKVGKHQFRKLVL